MPARKTKTTAATAEHEAEQTNNLLMNSNNLELQITSTESNPEENILSQSISTPASKAKSKPSSTNKRASKKVISESESDSSTICCVDGFPSYEVPPQLKTVETMEHIKSKIEMFDKSQHIILLQSILQTYDRKMNDKNDVSSIIRQTTIDEFKNQITQNQNGIFLNLTSCTDDLWQSCVQCIEQMEKQHFNLEMLDKERQMKMEQLRIMQSTVA